MLVLPEPAPEQSLSSKPQAGLDPEHWPDLRAHAHRMLDDMLDYTEQLRERTVWRQSPQPIRNSFRDLLPQKPTDLASIHERFMRDILPYAAGNAHPAFFGWVNGAGTPVGMLADMLAAGLNANLAGRNQIPLEVERQVLQWVRHIFVFPDTATA